MLHPTPAFRELKERISIEHVLAHRGLLDRMQQRGDRIVGCCPVHLGDSPTAFVVSRSRNLWRCFTRCQAGGDVVELVRRLDQCSYRDVRRYLLAVNSAGFPDPMVPTFVAARTPRPFVPFTASLPLEHKTPWLQKKGISPETAQVFETGRYHGRGFLQGCVAVRLHDPDGAPLGYAARRMHPEEQRVRGKWALPPGFPRHRILYGFHRARPLLTARGIVVVECPWGVMRLAQLRVPAVALLGVHTSDLQEHLLGLAPTVVLLMDGDDAGREADLRIRQRLQSRCRIRSACLPDGHDPDDLADADLAALVIPLLRTNAID